MDDLNTHDSEAPIPVSIEDRRHEARRSDDKIADSFSRVLSKTAKVAGACLVLGAFIGSVSAFIGIRLTGPRDGIAAVQREARAGDSLLSIRVDSAVAQIGMLHRGQDAMLEQQRVFGETQRIQGYTLCIIARRIAPDVRPDGCDASPRTGGTRP